MEAARRTLAALLVAVAVAVGGCDDGNRTAAPATPVPAAEASPVVPHVSGPLRLLVQPGLRAMTPDECDPQGHRVCSRGLAQTWAPLGDPHPVTLLEVGTRLNAEHTSWTTALRLDRDSSATLSRAKGAASASGGFVLLTTTDHVVLAAAAPDQVSGPRIEFAGLDKPTAWRLVSTFDLHE